MVISVRVLMSSTGEFKMMVAGGVGVFPLGDTAGSSRQPMDLSSVDSSS
jgi:hypothetical protein